MANDVSVDKKTAVFLSLLGETTYDLLRSLCSPALPSSKTYADLATLLTKHLEPEPLIITERFYFHKRYQAVGETVSEFSAELRRLAARCKFPEDSLEDTIRDRFVCGLLSEPTQRRLLTEKTLTLKTAVEIAVAAESADRSAKSFKEPESSVNLVSSRRRAKSDTVSCYRCGKKSHEAKNCRFRNEICFCCGRRGHIASVCRSSKQHEPEESTEDSKPKVQPSRGQRQQQRSSRHVRFMDQGTRIQIRTI